MDGLADVVDRVAGETGFSGVVRVDRGGAVAFAQAYGLADRRHRIPMTTDSQLALASGSKAFTALVVMRLVEQGRLELSTPARSVLGGDLALIADDVTIEHLLAHRSGIGDYLDEDVENEPEYPMTVAVQYLAQTEQYLSVLDGFSTKFAAGEGFSYCNGGYVVLAIIAERVAGVGFHDLVRQWVCEPAAMADTGYQRSDDLSGRAATGYVLSDGAWRTNVFHLPVRGSGDGGAYSTAADIQRFWRALFEGRIVAAASVAEMTRPRSATPSSAGFGRYGMGFWLHDSSGAVAIEGCDAGVSFRSVHDPATRGTHTVIGNTTDNAWPICRAVNAYLAAEDGGVDG